MILFGLGYVSWTAYGLGCCVVSCFLYVVVVDVVRVSVSVSVTVTVCLLLSLVFASPPLPLPLSYPLSLRIHVNAPPPRSLNSGLVDPLSFHISTSPLVFSLYSHLVSDFINWLRNYGLDSLFSSPPPSRRLSRLISTHPFPVLHHDLTFHIYGLCTY